MHRLSIKYAANSPLLTSKGQSRWQFLFLKLIIRESWGTSV